MESGPTSIASQPGSPDLGRRCEGCGYSLIGLIEPRCPECGRKFDPNEWPLARIPRLHRRELGLVTAYVRTVWRVCAEPRAFAYEFCTPVRVGTRDSEQFRQVTLLVAVAAGLMAVVALIALSVWRSGSHGIEVVPCITLVVGAALVAWIVLMLATDKSALIGGFTGPWWLRTLRYYAVAPLALLAIPAGLAMLAGLAQAGGAVWNALLFGAIGLSPINVGQVWWITLVFLRIAARHDQRQIMRRALFLLMYWLLLGWIGGLAIAMIVLITVVT